MEPRDLSRPLTEVRFAVGADGEGGRLDSWLRTRVPWRSRSDLQRRIARGAVLLDGAPARKGARLQAGQVVTVLVDEGPARREVPTDAIPLRTIFEDRWLVALDKAPGTVCHPVGRHVMDTIINALHVRYRDEGVRPMIVHRLDRETSGVLVLAKDRETCRLLGRAFEERAVEKRYLALVAGRVAEDGGSIELPIGPDRASGIRVKVACVAGGRPSRTDFEVLARPGGFSLLRCLPRTGRQHQIRVHLAARGHPVLCDRLYGRPGPLDRAALGLPGDATAPAIDRQALHAERLCFTHPHTGRPLTLEAPLAPDLASLLPA